MARWLLVAVLVFGAVGVLPGCFGERVTGQQAQTLVEDGAFLLDVRTTGEYADGHIDGAVNIPVSDLESRLAELPEKDASIVVYCKSGIRSSRAKKMLEEQGFEKVHDLGAMSRW